MTRVHAIKAVRQSDRSWRTDAKQACQKQLWQRMQDHAATATCRWSFRGALTCGDANRPFSCHLRSVPNPCHFSARRRDSPQPANHRCCLVDSCSVTRQSDRRCRFPDGYRLKCSRKRPVRCYAQFVGVQLQESAGSEIHRTTCSARSSPRTRPKASPAAARPAMVSSPSASSLRYSTLDSRAPSVVATAPIRVGSPISSRTPRFDNSPSSAS